LLRYIAFLRGINVGGHRVKMDRLRELFRELGFDDVTTFIASGNVLFGDDSADVAALRRTIEQGLSEGLGYEVDTFLRTPDRLAEIVGIHPDGGPTASHYVLFLHGPAPASLRSDLAALESDTDRFTFDGDEVHWWIGVKMSESPLFGGALERVLRPFSNTMRNVTTLRRIVAKVTG
jgi:uncharacterized protein (DUF1697 family)